MFSVIIPTLWKVNFLEEIKKLNNHSLVGEIIIINNSYKDTPSDLEMYDKVRMYVPSKNIFVNPAWNIGVKLSKFDLLMIHNDDIISDYEHLEQIQTKLEKEDCLIGIDPSCYSKKVDIETPVLFEFTAGDCNVGDWTCVPWGWGCSMYMRKNSYRDLFCDVWFGDDLLINRFKNQNKNIYAIQNANLSGSKISQSVSVLENESNQMDIDFQIFQNVKFEYVNKD